MVRGGLYPAFNRTGADLDITWRQGVSGSPPYSLMFQHTSDCTGIVARSGSGSRDASGTVLQAGYTGSPCIGRTLTLSSNTQDLAPFLLVVGYTDQIWNSIQLPLDLGPFGAPGCSVYCSQHIVVGPLPPATPLPLAASDPLGVTIGS